MEQVYAEWNDLIYSKVGGEAIEPACLSTWSEDELLFARTYIGRELSRRALSDNPDATASL